MAAASNCSQSQYFTDRHFIATAYAINSVVISIINCPLYLIRSVANLLFNVVQLEFKKMGEDLRDDLLGASQSFLTATLGTFYVFVGLFFPGQLFGLFSAAPLSPIPEISHEEYQRERQQLEHAQGEIGHLREELNELTRQQNEAREELGAFQGQTQSSEQRIRELEEFIEALDRQKEELKEEVRDLTRKLSEETEKVQDFESDWSEMEQECRKMEEKVKQKEEERGLIHRKNQDLSGRIINLTNENKRLEEALDRVEKENALLHKSNRELEDRVKMSPTETLKLQAQSKEDLARLVMEDMADLQKKGKKDKKEFDERMNSLRLKHKSASTDAALKQLMIDSLCTELDQAEEVIKTLASRLGIPVDKFMDGDKTLVPSTKRNGAGASGDAKKD